MAYAGAAGVIAAIVNVFVPVPIDITLGRYVFNVWAVLGPTLLLAATARELRVRDARLAHFEASRPDIKIECGNDIQNFVRQWAGGGATAISPLVLLRITNEGAIAAEHCQAEVTFEPNDARFPSPRALPWFVGATAHRLEPTLAVDLPASGERYLVFVDPHENDLALGTTVFTDDGDAYREAKVSVWARGTGSTTRRFRIVWFRGGGIPTVHAIDGGPPCSPADHFLS